MDLKEKTWGLVDEDRCLPGYPVSRLNLIGQQRLVLKDVANRVLALVFKRLSEQYEKRI